MLANYGDVWSRVAEAVPDRIAIREVGGRTLDYAAFADEAARVATLLEGLGVTAGGKVAIAMHNTSEWLVAMLAAFRLGAAPVPVNYRYRSAEIDGILDDSDAQALVYPASLAEVVGGLEQPGIRGIALVEVDDVRDGDARVDDAPTSPLVPGAVAFTDAAGVAPLPPGPAPASAELFLYTGGTTGRPKGVVWGVAEMFDVQTAAMYGLLGIDPPADVDAAIAVAADPAVAKPVTLPLAPLMHGTAMTSTINTLAVGGTVVLVPAVGFDAAQALRAMAELDVTRLIVAGDSVALRLLEALDESGVTELPRLTSVVSSGMRFSDDVKGRLHDLGDLTITDYLAASEGGPFATAVSRSRADLPARLRLGPAAVLVDEQRQPVAAVPGALGVLAFGGSLPKGYYKDEAKSAATFPVIAGRRHVMPGDWARVLDDHGAIELLGRGSAVVNTGGEKVYPVEVEEVLLTHPAIDDAVVLGIPDRRWGEALVAVVAARHPQTVDEAELIAHVGRVLAGYKKPKRIVVQRSLDRSPTGKVDLAVLRSAFV